MDHDLAAVAGKRLLQAPVAPAPSPGGLFLSDYAGGDAAAIDDATRRRVADWERATRLLPGWLDEKLAALGLDRRALLAIVAGAGVARAPLAWRAGLDELLAAERPLPAAALVREDDEHRGERVPFWGFVQRFVAWGAERVRGAGPLSARADADLLRGLALELGRRLQPALILELHRARARGELRGVTPRERYESFAGPRWADPGAVRALLDEYPVLARLLVETVGRWAEATREMLLRYGADDAVARQIPGAARGRIAHVLPQLSDPHHGNRAVAILEDEAGRRVVYKPRPLAIDARFFELLGWLNRQGLAHPHRGLAILDRGDHGWMEHAAAAELADAAGGARFYWRVGSLIALLYFVRGQDFHYQNLVAMGEHPVPLDLEAILCPSFPRGAGAPPPAASVLETGLVLRPIPGPDGRPTDLSGVGGGDGPNIVRPGVLDAYTDAMRIGPRERPLPPGSNRPRLDGRALLPRDHAGDIVAGFRASYDRIAAARGDLAALLDGCAGLEVRFIPRPTQRYGVLVQESCHPDYLRDALDTEMLLDILHLEAHVLPPMRRLIPVEQADLRGGDFPRFTARPGERHLYDARGGRLDDFFERTSLELARARLDAAGPDDRERQAAILLTELGGAAGRVDAAA
jgi:type 2 lantibiotic biosynthesis protein LanM